MWDQRAGLPRCKHSAGAASEPPAGALRPPRFLQETGPRFTGNHLIHHTSTQHRLLCPPCCGPGPGEGPRVRPDLFTSAHVLFPLFLTATTYIHYTYTLFVLLCTCIKLLYQVLTCRNDWSSFSFLLDFGVRGKKISHCHHFISDFIYILYTNIGTEGKKDNKKFYSEIKQEVLNSNNRHQQSTMF